MHRHLIAFVLAAFAASSYACQPKEAEGTGSAIRLWAEPKTYRGLIAWTCPDGTVVWYGVFDTAQHLAVPRTPEKVRAFLLQHRIWNAHAGDWLKGLEQYVPLAKEN